MCTKTKILTFFTLLTLGPFLFSATVTPALALTISEERELGDEFVKHARQAYDFVEDPFVNYYINRLGRKLVAAFPEQAFDFHFYVIKNPVYNAFAAPAGHVFIHSGLISAMDSEDELAGILAHEIAHVYCRHISEKIDKSKKLSLATLAGITAGIFLGSGALAIGSAAAGETASLAYSRQDERQADQIGVQYLAAANYSAEGLLTMLKKIKEKHWFSELDIPTYLTTHPGTDERIIYIDSLLASDRYRPVKPQPTENDDDFKLARTIIVATCDDADLVLNQMAALVDRDENNALAQLGYALALSRKARQEEAVAHLQAALAQNVFVPQVLTALGIIRVLMGDYEKALATFESVPKTPYWDYEMQFFKAQAAEKCGQPDKSIALLEDLIKRKPDYNEAVYALGMTYGRNDHPEQAHYYLGLYYHNIKDPKNALFHLKKAYALTSDPEKRKEIEDLMKDTKEDRRPPQTELVPGFIDMTFPHSARPTLF